MIFLSFIKISEGVVDIFNKKLYLCGAKQTFADIIEAFIGFGFGD